MAYDDYPPEAARLLAGMEPRPEGVTIGEGPEHWWASIDGLAPEPVAVWRDAGSEQDPPQPWGAERLGHEGVLWPGRVRLIARAIPPAESSDVRYSVEDGPGSSDRVELAVRVLIGSERSTVIVADPITGRALARDVLSHGREADVAAAAVEAAILARLGAQQPALDYSHRLLPDGTPRRPLDDAETARHMRARGFSETEVLHVLGHLPASELPND